MCFEVPNGRGGKRLLLDIVWKMCIADMESGRGTQKFAAGKPPPANTTILPIILIISPNTCMQPILYTTQFATVMLLATHLINNPKNYHC